jgi:SAM-dependent methyltransferase
MFFPDRIISIKNSDRVLEIGPGATPFHRSDEFLELKFDSDKDRFAQSGHIGILQTDKPVHYYDGSVFPFADKSYDYIVCSHVLEHVPDVELFLSEMTRVAQRGYIEFPTIYYDYLYNIPEHLQLLNVFENRIYHIPKHESALEQFKFLHGFFQNTLEKGYHDIIDANKDVFFKGFEWEFIIPSERVGNIEQLRDSENETRIIKKKVLDPWQINYNNISLINHIKFKLKKAFKL